MKIEVGMVKAPPRFDMGWTTKGDVGWLGSVEVTLPKAHDAAQTRPTRDIDKFVEMT